MQAYRTHDRFFLGLVLRVGLYEVDRDRAVYSKPHACMSASGMYFEFLLRHAHSRRRGELTYWSGARLKRSTARSNEVGSTITGASDTDFPQLGFPRRFAIAILSLINLT